MPKEKITYPYCFTHNRVFNQTLGAWEKALDTLKEHFEVHLEAAQCDLCEGNQTKEPP